MKALVQILPLASFFIMATSVGALSYSETVIADAPIHFWRLGEKNGLQGARDIIGENHGTYTNGVTLGEASGLENDPDTAASFNGINQYVRARNPFFQTSITNFTIEFWMRTTMVGRGGPQNPAFFGHGLLWADVPRDANDWAINLLGDRVAFFDGSLPATDLHRTIFSSSPVNRGDWVHVVVTREAGRQMKIYINGHEENSRSCGSAVLDGLPDFYFGSNFGDHRYYNGSIDDVAIYDKVLESWQIQQHYDARSNPPGIVDQFEPRGDNVSPSPLIEIVINTSRVAVDRESIRLEFNNLVRTPSLSTNEKGQLVVSYEPEELLQPGTTQTARVVYAVKSSPPTTNSFSYEFKISSQVAITK